MHTTNTFQSKATNLIPFPRRARRKRERHRPEPFGIIGQTFRVAKWLRRVERQAVDDDSCQPSLVSLGALRINTEKLARVIPVPPENWERLPNRILERSSCESGRPFNPHKRIRRRAGRSRPTSACLAGIYPGPSHARVAGAGERSGWRSTGTRTMGGSGVEIVFRSAEARDENRNH